MTATEPVRDSGRSLHLLAGQLARLFNPRDELTLVEVVVLVDVEVAHLVVLGALGGTGSSDVPRKNCSWTYFV